MNHSTSHIAEAGRRLKLAIVLLSAAVFLCANATEQTLPLLETRTVTYTNVTVTTKSAEYVFILHAGGMANIKVKDLSTQSKRDLGYVVPEDKPSQSVVMMNKAKQLVPDLQNRIKPFEEKWQSTVPFSRDQIRANPKIIYGAIGVGVLLYFFYSYLCHLICIKSKKAPSALVWFPILKWIPLLRAAEMSAWWLLVMFVPIVPIVWAFKIAKARGMSFWVSIFLLLPGTGPLAFLYLALARETGTKEAPRHKSMTLQTA